MTNRYCEAIEPVAGERIDPSLDVDYATLSIAISLKRIADELPKLRRELECLEPRT